MTDAGIEHGTVAVFALAVDALLPTEPRHTYRHFFLAENQSEIHCEIQSINSLITALKGTGTRD